MEWLHFYSYKSNNETNSESTFDWEVLYTRVHSPRGIAHKIVMNVVWLGPIPIAYVEVYAQWQWLRGSVGRIDFYGAFFHFKDSVPERYIRLYNELMRLAEKTSKVRITRVDIAMDFAYDFPQNGWSWIVPSGNSSRQVSCYKHQGLWNSYWYLSGKNSGYWVRIYDKLIDIAHNWKEDWYWWKEKLPKNWTRIEFEFYPPYTVSNDDNKLKEMCLARTCWNWVISIWLEFRPTMVFKVENAYNYFERYAKNHWITIKQLIDEVVKYYNWTEMKKNWQLL